jgi:hypothetical protein
MTNAPKLRSYPYLSPEERWEDIINNYGLTPEGKPRFPSFTVYFPVTVREERSPPAIEIIYNEVTSCWLKEFCEQKGWKIEEAYYDNISFPKIIFRLKREKYILQGVIWFSQNPEYHDAGKKSWVLNVDCQGGFDSDMTDFERFLKKKAVKPETQSFLSK